MTADLQRFKELIAKAASGQALSEAEATDAFGLMMTGNATPAQIAGLLMALRVRGETVEEITAGARSLRERMARIEAPAGAIDTCGTGGDGAGTFNISTASAFVVAAAGAKVAKHGNRSVSSKSGSADLLEAAGVNLDLTPEQVAQCVNEIGVGYYFDATDTAPKRFSEANNCTVDRTLTGNFAHYWTQNFGRRNDVYPLVIGREAYRTTQCQIDLYLYGAGLHGYAWFHHLDKQQARSIIQMADPYPGDDAVRQRILATEAVKDQVVAGSYPKFNPDWYCGYCPVQDVSPADGDVRNREANAEKLRRMLRLAKGMSELPEREVA